MPSVPALNLDHFAKLQKFGGTRRDASNSEHARIYEELKQEYGVVKEWALQVKAQLFPEGWVEIRRRPINQGGSFIEYTWAKLYPFPNAPKALAYTIGTGDDYGLVVKIDAVDTAGGMKIRSKVEELRNENGKDSSLIAFLSPEDGCHLSLDELTQWAVDQIRGFNYSYQEIVDRLGLRSEGNLLEANEIISSGGSVAKENRQAVNRILYGPPGTGKTFSTPIHAIALADRLPVEVVSSRDRAAILARWKQLRESGHIEFVTFHPAMTYEDFVEGMKPITVDGQVTYHIREGILRAISTKAKGALTGVSAAKRFDDILARLAEEPITLTTLRGKPFDVKYLGNTTFRVRPHATTAQDEQWHPVNIQAVRQWMAGEDIEPYNLSYVKALAEYIKAEAKDSTALPREVPDFVLIIDEINRGNIPAIFGELITLIEPDKRSGADEALSVVLPGSQQPFSIPRNLHLLGTMNTADRSVEALDIALRRRFDFVEMAARPEILDDEDCVVEGLKLSDLLRTLNQRLEALLDRDHTLGHAFFVGVHDFEGLRQVFENKVIPLLCEFFHGEWHKIGLVLGKGFVRLVPQAVRFASGFEFEDELPSRYELVAPGEWSLESFRQIIQA